MELGAYRRRAEAFIGEFDREHYRHFAGLKDEYEIDAIYDEYAELFSRATVEEVRALLEASSAGSEQRRRLRMLLDFAVQGYIGEATKAAERELAGREAAMTIEIDGERMGFRDSAVAQANEPDAGRRGLIEAARLELIESELGALYREVLERQHECARSLGWPSYLEMCRGCQAVDFTRLAEQSAQFAAASRDAYPSVLEPELQRTLGIGLAELRRADLPRFFRAADADPHFPADRLLPAFVETMRGLGIEVLGQRGVILDLDPRPGKSPRAFCAPVRTPGEVYLMLSPVGGRDDYSVLFHESGHAEHAAHVDPGLPFEFRYLGDNAITEAYAFLFQHLVDDPGWLERRLGVEDAAALVAHARAQRLVYLRRYAAKLAYELELHGQDGAGSFDALADRYAAILGGALMIEWPRQTFLADVDPAFYCACYLRAWVLETHLRGWLRDRYGGRWFETAQAAEALRELWSQGQRLTPEELLATIGGGELDFRVLLDDLELAPD